MTQLPVIALSASLRFAALLCACWLLPASAQTPHQPEAASGFVARPAVDAPTAMVVSANPHATAAALAILRAGGSASDAAIAAVLVLNVVEPQSSGIGGGAFLLHYRADEGSLQAWDGRESAPAAVDETLFLKEDGERMGFHDAAVGGRAVGAPGLLRLLAAVHAEHGRLPWAQLLQPAIDLAEGGFAVSPRLHALIARDRFLYTDPAARALFYDAAGEALAVGSRFTNPALAAVLRAVAEEGAEVFYHGALAADIVAAVARAPNPGTLSLRDLADWRPLKREALCAPYRQWAVCGMPPPSSGGGTVLAMLGILQGFPLPEVATDSAFATHLFAEAGRLAFADRDAWYADPRAMPLTPQQLLGRDYLAGRAAQIDLRRSMTRAEAGTPADSLSHVAAQHPERAATTHISIVDAAGNAVALTASIEDAFGSRRMVHGFLLNNQLTDFSFQPQDAHGHHPNRAGPGKRPRSSMAPTLVFAADGSLHAVLGSPGGSAIINYVAATLIGVLDWQLPPDLVLARPHAGSRNGPTEVEDTAAGHDLARRLQMFGHDVVLRDLTSGLALIVRSGQGGWTGAADPRREGVAAGY